MARDEEQQENRAGEEETSAIVGSADDVNISPFLTFSVNDGEVGGAMGADVIPVYFREDWSAGLGGGLWSTGLAMAKYFCYHSEDVRKNLERLLHRRRRRRRQDDRRRTRAQRQLRRRQWQQKREGCFCDEGGIRALELGSGNGFLAVCLSALSVASSSSHDERVNEKDDEDCGGRNDANLNAPPLLVEEIIVTDTADHLPMIERTLDANAHLIERVDAKLSSSVVLDGTTTDSFIRGGRRRRKVRVSVLEHLWGEFNCDSDNDGFSNKNDGTNDTFDLIFGSDLAYRDDLHEPLISSLLRFAHSDTVCLIGVTMTDTKPEFFVALRRAGFRYERLADRLMEPDFRGTVFGLFVIWKEVL